jgi:hypothetical protein
MGTFGAKMDNYMNIDTCNHLPRIKAITHPQRKSTGRNQLINQIRREIAD